MSDHRLTRDPLHSRATEGATRRLYARQRAKDRVKFDDFDF